MARKRINEMQIIYLAVTGGRPYFDSQISIWINFLATSNKDRNIVTRWVCFPGTSKSRK